MIKTVCLEVIKLKNQSYILNEFELKIKNLEEENLRLKQRIEDLENAIRGFEDAISSTLS